MTERPARESELVALDFETTGTVGAHRAEPWQIGWVRLRGGVVDPVSAFTSLIRVGDRPFSPHAPGAHHRLRAEIARAPAFPDLAGPLLAGCGAVPLIAHNVPTERAWLRRAAPLHRWGPWIDTLTLARAAWPALPSHELGAVVESLGLLPRLRALAPAWTAHDALSDAFASAVIVEHLLADPRWAGLSVAALSALRPPRARRR